jgi:hypothetical protein
MGVLRIKRFRTAREDAMYAQVQAAMNWRPEFATQQPDGRWVNAYGVEFEHMTLEELLEREGLSRASGEGK